MKYKPDIFAFNPDLQIRFRRGGKVDNGLDSWFGKVMIYSSQFGEIYINKAWHSTINVLKWIRNANQT